jgi:uncharacterized membrane protein
MVYLSRTKLVLHRIVVSAPACFVYAIIVALGSQSALLLEEINRDRGTAMAMQMMTWLIAIPLLGLVTGMRTFTPMAVLCWFAYFGYLPVGETWASWTAKMVTAIVFTVLALGELVGDKLPRTPSRTALLPLIFRLAFGGLIGAIVAAGLNGSGVEGVILGMLGVAVGAFGGFLVRRELVLRLGCKDWPVALVEDASAIVFAVFALGVITG